MATLLPHLQYAVLGALSADALSGRELRARLEAIRVHRSGPAFYRLMSRLEEAGFVKGWYEQEIVDGQIVRERYYKVTGAGAKARGETADFHRRVVAAFSPEGRARA